MLQDKRRMEKKSIDIKQLSPSFTLTIGNKDISISHIDALLLNFIDKEHSLASASRKIGISYRNAWDRINKMQKSLGHQLVTTRKGGREGGKAELTPDGIALLNEYRKLNEYLFNALADRDFWQHAGFKLSARNRLKGKVISIEKGSVTSQVRIRVSGENILTSIVSNEAVDDLAIEVGDEIYAIIKATEVILAK
jgi:molybdate transport system regulatory protein